MPSSLARIMREMVVLPAPLGLDSTKRTPRLLSGLVAMLALAGRGGGASSGLDRKHRQQEYSALGGGGGKVRCTFAGDQCRRASQAADGGVASAGREPRSHRRSHLCRERQSCLRLRQKECRTGDGPGDGNSKPFWLCCR